MTEELLPCPFCGEPMYYEILEVIISKRRPGELGLQAACMHCRSRGPWVEGTIDDEGNAIRAWNTRPRTIPKWLKEILKDSTDGFQHCGESYNTHRDGYYEAMKQILSLEEK